jgi:hypothetical protein
MTLKSCVGPAQPARVGVMTILAETLAFVTFGGAVNGAIWVFPLATRPIAVFEFSHINVAPDGVETNVEGVIVAFGQTSKSDGLFIVGVGLTVIWKFIGALSQPSSVFFTEIVVETFAFVAFAAEMKVGKLPIPLALARPTAIFEFVQLNTETPVFGVAEKAAVVTVAAGQTV